MKELLTCIVMTLALVSCSHQPERWPVSKPKPFFGDSLLSISFESTVDTATNRELRNAGVTELMTLGYRNDTTIINMYRKLAPGSYKGACEFKKDTLHVNYRMDSVSCGSPCMNLMTYKIRAKNISAGKLKTHFIYTGNAPKTHSH